MLVKYTKSYSERNDNLYNLLDTIENQNYIIDERSMFVKMDDSELKPLEFKNVDGNIESKCIGFCVDSKNKFVEFLLYINPHTFSSKDLYKISNESISNHINVYFDVCKNGEKIDYNLVDVIYNSFINGDEIYIGCGAKIKVEDSKMYRFNSIMKLSFWIE
jgi:hypothetical protein